uniref:protein XRI1-like n=1 Tax=Erigeron canadensis TaxID=72917 RepID=UPI001CB8CCDA|nr:protein XRI1-like [Erigeron canadensis]
MNCNNNDNAEMWDWQGEDYCLQTNAYENVDDLSSMFDETTPAKSFEDVAYQVTENENIDKGTERCRETYSQVKRRRMLHFDNEDLDVDIISLCDDDYSSIYLKSKEREACLDGALSEMDEWVAGFADETSACGSGYDGLDQSSEGWIADCLIDDTDMHISDDEMNPSGSAATQTDLTESNYLQLENEGCTGREHPTPTRRNITFKGKKSFIKPPRQVASSVVLPFAFIKPFGMQGAVTLKDINQKILAPPPPKSKKTSDNPTKSYPTSAFSGKPVVGKTKIHTEGGKGSITIMRTRG